MINYTRLIASSISRVVILSFLFFLRQPICVRIFGRRGAADGTDNNLLIEGSWTFLESSARVARDAITIPPSRHDRINGYLLSSSKVWVLRRQLTLGRVPSGWCERTTLRILLFILSKNSILSVRLRNKQSTVHSNKLDRQRQAINTLLRPPDTYTANIWYNDENDKLDAVEECNSIQGTEFRVETVVLARACHRNPGVGSAHIQGQEGERRWRHYIVRKGGKCSNIGPRWSDRKLYRGRGKMPDC